MPFSVDLIEKESFDIKLLSLDLKVRYSSYENNLR